MDGISAGLHHINIQRPGPLVYSVDVYVLLYHDLCRLLLDSCCGEEERQSKNARLQDSHDSMLIDVEKVTWHEIDPDSDSTT
jgi:hypothetical protein